MRGGGRARGTLLVVLLALPLLLYLAGPIVGLMARTTPSVWESYVCCWQAASALRLSLVTASIALIVVIIIGTPVAYWLAHYDFRGKGLIDTLIDLPLVLPPAAAGFALLLLFGQQGIGSWLQLHGLRISLTPLAVVMAQVFVASPFYVKQARAGFEAVPQDLRLASATLGAGPARTFLRVTAPLSSPALLAGAVMTWARALGEFGATLVFAGAFPGRTETMPIAIYTTSTTNLPAAIALACTLVIVSFAVLVVTREIAGRRLRISLAP
ncbi:MAG: ABC transporter permease [Anaerolineae bacterium]|nr:ABC transporter permease [Anaerolineae bacterium]